MRQVIRLKSWRESSAFPRFVFTVGLSALEAGGIVGLRDKAGRGRKPILKAADLPQIKAVVQANAQQLKVARQKLKEELGREFSAKTLKRFLKNLTADIKDGANV